MGPSLKLGISTNSNGNIQLPKLKIGAKDPSARQPNRSDAKKFAQEVFGCKLASVLALSFGQFAVQLSSKPLASISMLLAC